MKFLLVFLVLCCASTVALAQSIIGTSYITTETFGLTGAVGNWGKSGNSSLLTTSSATNSGVLVIRGKGQEVAFYSTPGFQSKTAWIESEVNLFQVKLPNATSSEHWRIPSRSVSFMNLKGPTYKLLIELLVFKEYGTGNLRGALLSGNWALVADTFPLPNDDNFHLIAAGYDIKAGHIGVWIDGILAFSTNFTQVEKYGVSGSCGIISNHELPKSNLGSIGIRSCSLLLPSMKDMYVNSNTGNDETNDGSSASKAFKTISKASYNSIPGCTIHIADGIYRETIRPTSGLPGKDIVFKADGKKAYLYGSISGDSLSWTKTTSGLWVADVSGLPYFQKTPRFIALMNRTSGKVISRLRIARDPNYKVDEIWRFVEYWNVAEGGNSIPTCTPGENNNAQDCDKSTRSPNALRDSKLKNYASLIGAKLIVSDCNSGHYIYKRNVIAHDKTVGSLTVDSNCYFDGDESNPSLGLFSAYYLENMLQFLDVNGEYVLVGNLLYIKLSSDIKFSDLEISIVNTTYSFGIHLSGKSNVRLEGLKFMFYQSDAIVESSGWNSGSSGSHNITITNCTILYCNNGINLVHGCAEPTSTVSNWIVDHCEIGQIDAVSVSTNTPATNNMISISDFTLKNSYIHDIGFNSDAENRIGAGFLNAKNFRILNNKITRVSHNGFQFSLSTAINGQIATGGILVRGNVWNQACCSNADCGCLKFWSRPESHAWKDVLVTENICESTFGFTRPSYNRHLWQSSGYGGFGWYTDHVSGIAFFRNIAYNIADYGVTMYRYWEDKTNIIYNNLLIGSAVGISLGGKNYNQTATTHIKNNVFYGHQYYSVWQTGTSSALVEIDKMIMDNNLYWKSGWHPTFWKPGFVVVQDSSWKPLPTFDAIHTYSSNKWETTSYSFDPGYNLNNGTSFNSSSEFYQVKTVPSHMFDVTNELKDKGTSSLPTELTNLLTLFGVPDQKRGANYDLGPTEMDTDGSVVDSELPDNGEIIPWDNGNENDQPIELPSYNDENSYNNKGSNNEINQSSNNYQIISFIVISISILITTLQRN